MLEELLVTVEGDTVARCSSPTRAARSARPLPRRRPRRAARALPQAPPRHGLHRPASPRSRACAALRELSGDRAARARGRQGPQHRGVARLPLRARARRHGGSFSLMVNFHALGWYAERHGGDALNGGDRHEAIDVAALAVRRPAAPRDAARLQRRDRPLQPRRPLPARRGHRARRARALGRRDRRAAAAERLGRVHAARRHRRAGREGRATPTRRSRRTCAPRCSPSGSATTPCPATRTCRSRSAA